MTQITLLDAANNTIFHMSIRRGPGVIIFNAKIDGSWGKERRIALDHRFRAEDGATFMIHEQGEGYEVWIDWVHPVWFPKQGIDQTAVAIYYGLGDDRGITVLSDELEVRTYPSMKALFLQKHEREEEKVTPSSGGGSLLQTIVSMR
jgi:hypothetical protein